MMYLLINGKKYMPINNGFSYTKQIGSICKPFELKAGFTSQFEIPLIKDFAGLKLLNYTGEQFSRDFFDAELYVNGLQILYGKGFVIGIDYKKNTAKIVLYNTNVSLFKMFGDTTFSSIGISELNHDITQGNIRDNIYNDYTKGYVYALSDYGGLVMDNGNINSSRFLPSLYIRWLWEKMLYYFNLSSNWSPPENDVITLKRGWKIDVEGNVNTFDLFWDGGVVDNIPDDGDGYGYVQLAPVNNNMQDNNYMVNILYNGYYDIVVNGTITHNQNGYFQSIPRQMYIIYKDNNGNYNTIAQLNPAQSFNSNGDVIVTYQGGVNVYLNNGGKLYFIIKNLPQKKCVVESFGVGSDTSTITYCTENEYNFSNNFLEFKTAQSQTGQFDANKFIGDVKLVDFFKDILAYYGITARFDGNNLIVKKWSNVLTDVDNSNLFDKFNESTIKSITHRPDVARSNVFAYNYYNENDIHYADGKINVSNETIDDNKIFFKRPYMTPLQTTTDFQGYSLLNTLLFKPKINSDGTVSGWASDSKRPYFTKVDDIKDITFTMENEAGQTMNLNNVNVKKLNFQDCSFQNSINNNYYNFVHIWNNFTRIEIEGVMLLGDFVKLNLQKTYLFKKLGVTLFIEKIKWNNNKVSITGVVI